MNASTEDLLKRISLELQVNPRILWALIQHESGWNPIAKNNYSSAKGLLQWIDATALELGYNTSQELINKLPTIDQQLQYAVLPYLKRRMPFSNPQSLFMSVFYPKARTWPDYQQFPDSVQRANPGIKTPSDYIKKVYSKIALLYIPQAVILLGITALSFFFLKQ